MGFKFEYIFHILALVLVIFGSILIYSTHFKLEAPIFEPEILSVVDEPLGDYPYPLHVDSWNHMSMTKQLLEESWFPTTNPQIAGDYYHKSMERGFHIILASIVLLTGASLLKLFVVLPAIFFGIGSLLLYLFFAKSLKKPIVGLVTILFLNFIPSNANVLGFWFLTPSSLILPFLAGLLLILYEFKHPRNIIFGALLVFASFFIYPVMTILLLFILVVYLILEYKLWNYWKLIISKKYVWITGIVVVGFVLFLILLGSHMIFSPGWTATLGSQLIFSYLPLLLVFLGLGGLYFLYFKNKFFFFIVAVYSLFGIINSIFYFTIEYSIILPYQRILFQWSILILISAAFCLFSLFELFSKRVYLIKLKKNLFTLIFLLVVFLIVFLTLLPTYYDIKYSDYAIQKAVHEDQKILLDLINTVSSKIILADPFFSSAIYPLSSHKALFALNANLGGSIGPNYEKLLKELDCSSMNAHIPLERTDFIIINQELGCTFLNEIGFSGDYYLYLINKNSLPLPIEAILN